MIKVYIDVYNEDKGNILPSATTACWQLVVTSRTYEHESGAHAELSFISQNSLRNIVEKYFISALLLCKKCVINDMCTSINFIIN